MKGTVGALFALVESFLVPGGNWCLVCRVCGAAEAIREKFCHSQSGTSMPTELAGFYFCF